MELNSALESIEAIHIESPVEKIINQIRKLIADGTLKSGDRLPAERILAERFGVGRGYVREAILKMEFYGILKTSPQSGTYVSGLGVKVMDSIFADVITFNKDNYAALIEARYHMEAMSACLAAEQRTDEDIAEMKAVLKEFDAKTRAGQHAVQDDMIFHIKLAAATKNPVIESMIVILIPDLIKVMSVVHFEMGCDSEETIAQHHEILKAVTERKSDKAEKAMRNHLQAVMDYRKNIKNRPDIV